MSSPETATSTSQQEPGASSASATMTALEREEARKRQRRQARRRPRRRAPRRLVRRGPFYPLLPIFGFALLALTLSAGTLALILRQDLRHVVIDRPWWLLTAALPVLALVLRQALAPRPATLRFSRTLSARRLRPGLAAYLAWLPDGLRLAAAVLLAVALARPQSSRFTDRIEHEGIDIAVAIDLSKSMELRDMYPNRLEAAKAVIDEFITRRPHDRIGLVAFGSYASSVAPLTIDHGVLRGLLEKLQLGSIDGSRTAIGAGLGVALNRLDESEASSKVVVLVTDGKHNAGGINPDTAAEEAAERGVIVYTVLIGDHRMGSDRVDPAQLERISSITGGYAYKAKDPDSLRTTFQDLLDKLEKSTVAGEQVRAELFHLFLWPAFLLLLLDVLLRNTRLRRFP